MSKITAEQGKVNYVILDTCYERHRHYPYREITTVFKKPARRIEQAIFQTIVEMTYEMEAADIAERFIRSVESDFMMFKTMKTRKHKIENFNGATTSIKIRTPASIRSDDDKFTFINDRYNRLNMILPMGYNKNFKGSVVIGHYTKYNMDDYRVESDFQKVESMLQENLYLKRLIWKAYVLHMKASFKQPTAIDYPDYRIMTGWFYYKD